MVALLPLLCPPKGHTVHTSEPQDEQNSPHMKQQLIRATDSTGPSIKEHNDRARYEWSPPLTAGGTELWVGVVVGVEDGNVVDVVVGVVVGVEDGDEVGEVGEVEGSGVGLDVDTTKQKTKTQHYNDLMMVVKLLSS